MGQAAAQRELLVITGMSGAGRSTAGDVLEDLGWYVVDNLPPQMISPLVDLTSSSGSPDVQRVGVAVDVRGRSFFTEVRTALDDLAARGVTTHLLFLDAGDDALVRRFESVRRPHPLQGQGRLLDGIARERDMLAGLRAIADTVIDTSALNVHQLSARIAQAYGDNGPGLRVTVMSFGFKYGIPLDADHVADVRFLPNPFWVPELRPRTGLDEPVAEYVLSRPGAQEWLHAYVASLRPVLAGYQRENKRYATVGIGCTGGKHRSVAISETIARMLSSEQVSATTVHRDLGRE